MLGENSPYFTLQIDAVNRSGFSPSPLDCIAALRMLAYGSIADSINECKNGEKLHLGVS